MSTAHNRSVVESFYADIWNRGDKSKIPSLLSDSFNCRSSLGHDLAGPQALAPYVDWVHGSLANYRCDVLDLVAEGQKVFARLRLSGIHRGEFLGYMSSGKPVEWDAAARFVFDGKKIADVWELGDVQALLLLLQRNAGG